jgi:hypothetical protein
MGVDPKALIVFFYDSLGEDGLTSEMCKKIGRLCISRIIRLPATRGLKFYKLGLDELPRVRVY